MLKYLRKKMKVILIFTAVVFALSIFYGLSFRYDGKNEEGSKTKQFLKINGKEIDPNLYNRILNNLRGNYPERLSLSDLIYITNLAISQTVEFSLVLEEARREVGVSGSELNQALEDLSKEQKLNSVSELKKIIGRQKINWNEFKKMVKEDLMVQKLMAKKRQEAQVTPEDLREIKVRHLLIQSQKGKEEEARKRISKLYEKAKKGEDFASLAKQYSEDPGSKNTGGDLGYISTGMMVKPFEQAAFKLKIGEISAPVETAFGYHIIKLEDSRLRKVSTGTQEAAGKDVESVLLRQKQQRAFSDWLYNLKKDAKIEILDPSLKALDLRLKGKLNEAVLEYQNAIGKNPGNAGLHLFLGNLYEELKKDDLAVEEYNKAIGLSSGDPYLYIILGDLYVKMRENDSAVKEYRKASLIGGDDKSLHEELLNKFKSIGSIMNVRNEISEIDRINKKEAFEKELRDRSEKLKTK